MVMGTTPETQAAADEFARREGMNPDDLSLIEKFRSRVQNFMLALDNLASRKRDAQRSPQLATEYATLMRQGSVIKSTIESVSGTIDKVMAFFKGVTGMSALNVVPLLPIALITGAIAAIAKWTTDAYTFSKKLDEVQRLEAKGLTPQQAADVVARNAPAPLFGGFNLSNIVPLLAVGAVLFFWWRSNTRRSRSD